MFHRGSVLLNFPSKTSSKKLKSVNQKLFFFHWLLSSASSSCLLKLRTEVASLICTKTIILFNPGEQSL